VTAAGVSLGASAAAWASPAEQDDVTSQTYNIRQAKTYLARLAGRAAKVKRSQSGVMVPAVEARATRTPSHDRESSRCATAGCR
jgi:hypothetical protein